MVERPMVSVLMAAFNAAEFIGPAIESFLDQTYRASELLIVDDASTDGTASIVELYAEKEPSRVRLIRLGANGGHAAPETWPWTMPAASSSPGSMTMTCGCRPSSRSRSGSCSSDPK